MATQHLHQVVEVSIEGVGRIPIADKAGSFRPSGYKREHKAGMNHKDGGYTKTPTPAMLELNINLIGDDIFTRLQDIEERRATVTLANGKKYVMYKASSADPAIAEDGQSKLQIFSNESDEL